MDVDAFADHIVVHLRRNALTGIRMVPNEGEAWEIDFPESVFSVSPGENAEYTTGELRLTYESLVTPPTVYDYEIASRSARLRKQLPVLGGYDPSDYESEREWATAGRRHAHPDLARCAGTVSRRTVPRRASSTATGRTRSSIGPGFSVLRLPLLDRGFVFAIAHVRGGGELGRQWYEDGKLLHKRNTFTDFIACARHLVDERYTRSSARRATAGRPVDCSWARSLNLAPDLFAAVVAEVPFVDALTTILDPTLPLTVMECEEWGNPIEDADVYAYMKSYSPYDNVDARELPRHARRRPDSTTRGSDSASRRNGSPASATKPTTSDPAQDRDGRRPRRCVWAIQLVARRSPRARVRHRRPRRTPDPTSLMLADSASAADQSTCCSRRSISVSCRGGWRRRITSRISSPTSSPRSRSASRSAVWIGRWPTRSRSASALASTRIFSVASRLARR